MSNEIEKTKEVNLYQTFLQIFSKLGKEKLEENHFVPSF